MLIDLIIAGACALVISLAAGWNNMIMGATLPFRDAWGWLLSLQAWLPLYQWGCMIMGLFSATLFVFFMRWCRWCLARMPGKLS